MSKTLQWVIGSAGVVIIASLVFSTVAPFFFPQARVFGMMGGLRMPFFMTGLWLGPLLLIGLVVLGGVWLIQKSTTPGSAAALRCMHCGQPLQAGWKACPSCGEKL